MESYQIPYVIANRDLTLGRLYQLYTRPLRHFLCGSVAELRGTENIITLNALID